MRHLLAAILLLVPLAAGASECKYSAERKLDLDSAGLHRAQFAVGSSDTRIEGVAGLKTIEVRGRVCASREADLKAFHLTGKIDGDRALIRAIDDSHGGFMHFGYRYMDLTVRVPASLAMTIHSGSGDVQAHDLASLDVRSGSGDIQAHDIAGKLVLQLGSADARVEKVGSIDVRATGSGDVRATGVKQDVHVGHSGSGDIHVADVGGNVEVDATGSGDVGVRHVKGSVSVGSTGSGDVEAHNVGGDFRVGSSGSGDISYSHVHGTVSVPHDDD
jgi:hypothetical protein